MKTWRASPEVGRLRAQQMYLFQDLEKPARLDYEKKNKYIFINSEKQLEIQKNMI